MNQPKQPKVVPLFLTTVLLAFVAGLAPAALVFCIPHQAQDLVDADLTPAHGPAFAAAVPGIGNVNLEATKQTYTYSLGQTALLAGFNFGVQGSATKLVKLVHFQIGPCTATALGIQDVALRMFRSFSAIPNVSNANYFQLQGYGTSADAGQSATGNFLFFVGTVTTGPTLTAALRETQLVSLPAASLTSAPNTVTWNFCQAEICPTLVGADQAVLMSVAAGGALAGQKCTVEVSWTEE